MLEGAGNDYSARHNFFGDIIIMSSHIVRTINNIPNSIVHNYIRAGRRTLRIKDCKGVSSVKGLMFDQMKGIDGALIYANSIWMPFVKELDLFFLDGDFRVVEARRAVPITLDPKTWKIYKNEKAKYCLEVRKGVLRARKGMQIKMF